MSSLPPADRSPSVLLTGATSYLGSAITRRLLASGSTVTVVVRTDSALEQFTEMAVSPAVRVHDGSIESMIEVVREVEPDVVVHLATSYRREHTPDDVDEMVRSNIGFGTQLLEAMKLAGCRRLVTAGTYFQHYGTDGYRPVNLYAAMKQAFEDILAYYVDAWQFTSIALVLYDVYGPGDRRSKLMEAVRDAQRGGEPLRLPEVDIEMNFVYVDDAVEAFMRSVQLVLEEPTPAARRFSVGGVRQHRLSELISTFEEVSGRPVPHEWGAYVGPGRSVSSPWVGQTLPGWRPEWSLRDGVERFLADS
ncbi:MAG: NAD(P)-dependent oxidoreductase [Acidimicrobiia bacterium]|nr:NAD(P)-dependent oxidoreductase [Acidimicrobiia bacterium]